jgi:hypothetical protein
VRRGVRARAPGALALLLLFLLSLPAVTPRLYAADEIEYFAYLRSLWFDHDLSFDNEYRYFYDRGITRDEGFHRTFLELTSETGLRLNFGPIGSALMWTPMYGIADAGVRMARAFGSTVAADGFSQPYLTAVTYGSALYGFLAVMLAAAIARRIVGCGAFAGAVVWIGTPLLFYMYLAPGMSHACSAFAVSAFVAAWLAVRERWSTRGVMALGALAALMAMVREQDAFFVVGVALDFVWALGDDLRGGRRAMVAAKMKAAMAGSIVAAVCFAPQAWAYLVLNGRIGPARVVAEKMYWTSPHALQVLFSAEHGFLIWTPLALLAIAGLALGVARPAGASAGRLDHRRLLICLLVMVAAQVYITGSVDTWTVAGAFGQRRFVALTAMLVTGLAVLLSQARGAPRALLGVAIALSVWWNLGLMAQFGAGMMDRQRLEPARNAYNTFIVVPRAMPDLAYRYLFDRSSFYGPRSEAE